MKIDLGLTVSEQALFRRLSRPAKIQDFLNKIPINFSKHGDTIYSPRKVLRENQAHCLEGALLAAAILWFHGERPLIMDIRTVDGDFDHVVTLFKYKNHWGAISKTNHAVLRYREPVYASPRELAMSYFHEYFLDNGTKTMRSYSKPFDLSKSTYKGWVTAEEDLWRIEAALDDSPHHTILTKQQITKLRKADPVEIQAGKIVEWKR